MKRLLPVLLVGCNAACDAPNVFDTRIYEVFGNLVTFESTSPVGPPDAYPVNGNTIWSIDWGSGVAGPVTVTIDEQAFDGEGAWAAERCDTFSMGFAGTYVSPGAVRHTFEASGDFLYFDNVLEGSLSWSDRWTFGESSGEIDASEAAVVGLLIPQDLTSARSHRGGPGSAPR